MPAIENSVNIFRQSETPQADCFWSPIRPIKNLLLGVPKTIFGFCTFFNKMVLYPDDSILNMAPRIQKLFEYAAWKLNCNHAYHEITELHILDKPWYWLKIPRISLPKFPYIFGREIVLRESPLYIPLPKFPVMTYHSVSDNELIKAVTKSHRYEDGYNGGALAYEQAYQLLPKIFPETQFSREDFLLTCKKDFTQIGHKQIIKALKSERLEDLIANEGTKFVRRWEEKREEKEDIDLATEIRSLTSSVIASAGFKEAFENFDEVSDAVYFMNEYLFKKAMLRPWGIADKFQKACETFRKAINAVIKRDESEPLPLFNKDFSLAKKQGLSLFMFFAGQETTAFALTYILMALALNQKLQQDIYEAIRKGQEEGVQLSEIPALRKLINDHLLSIPPGDGISRQLEENTYVSFETKNGVIGKFMRADERILMNYAATAKNVLATKENPTYDDASVFGFGKNGCIGKNMALQELYHFVAIFLTRFKFTTKETKFEYISRATNQAKRCIVELEDRES